MKLELDSNDLYWNRINPNSYTSENKIDARWLLRSKSNKKPYGSLRIVSHPDLKYGYLRSIYTVVSDIKKRNKSEIIQTIEDYQMEEIELEVYSIDDDIKTETQTYEAPFKELEQLYGVKIFV